MRSPQLATSVVGAAALAIPSIAIVMVMNSAHPIVAVGIALQTLAGAFAAVRLWGNNASNRLVRWATSQIKTNRWHIARLLDGRFRSLLIATVLAAAGLFSLDLPGLAPNQAIGWLIAIVAILFLLAAVIMFLLALLVFMGSKLFIYTTVPEDEPLTVLRSRLDANDWVWPIVGVAFFAGGLLQIAAL